jgi:hypothetical protein
MPVFSLLAFLTLTGQLINSTFQYAMVLCAADPTTAIAPPVIVTLGSITYFFSVLEVIVDGFLARELRWERENDPNVNALTGEGGNGA